jgi:hypothetical protein
MEKIFEIFLSHIESTEVSILMMIIGVTVFGDVIGNQVLNFTLKEQE